MVFPPSTPSALSASSGSLLGVRTRLYPRHIRACCRGSPPLPKESPLAAVPAALYAGGEPPPYPSVSSQAQLSTAPAAREHPSDAAVGCRTSPADLRAERRASMRKENAVQAPWRCPGAQCAAALSQTRPEHRKTTSESSGPGRATHRKMAPLLAVCVHRFGSLQPG